VGASSRADAARDVGGAAEAIANGFEDTRNLRGNGSASQRELAGVAVDVLVARFSNALVQYPFLDWKLLKHKGR
jgi:hypothetical protein